MGKYSQHVPLILLHLRSKLDFQESLYANFIFNLQLLLDGLPECSKCHEGPPFHCATCQNVLFVLVWVLFYISAAATVTMNEKYDPTKLTVQDLMDQKLCLSQYACSFGHALYRRGLTHLHGTLSVLHVGIGSLSKNMFQKGEKEVGLAVESLCKESCSRFQEEEKSRSSITDGERHKLVLESCDGA